MVLVLIASTTSAKLWQESWLKLWMHQICLLSRKPSRKGTFCSKSKRERDAGFEQLENGLTWTLKTFYWVGRHQLNKNHLSPFMFHFRHLSVSCFPLRMSSVTVPSAQDVSWPLSLCHSAPLGSLWYLEDITPPPILRPLWESLTPPLSCNTTPYCLVGINPTFRIATQV